MSCPAITQPVFEHHHSGLGVATSKPRVSWRFKTSDATIAGWVQTSYELEIKFACDEKPQSYKEASDQSVLVPWPARDLASRETATVRVRVYGESLGDETYANDEPSAWSEPATVEAALLNRDDFRADFITAAQRVGPHGPLRPIRFRKEFTLPQELDLSSASARLYITSLGVFEAWINGKSVTDECMAPGWTSYKHRLVYRILDVQKLLIPGGKNTICVEVAEGWYAGRLGFKGGIRFRYGDTLGLFTQLEVKEGSVTSWSLLSDESWSCAPSALTRSEIYDGEVYDMREEKGDWKSVEVPGDTSDARILPWPQAAMVAPDAPPVRVIETKACIKVFQSKTGKTILDFGQNLVGKLFIKSVHLREGQEVTFRHAEVMENDELGTRPLRDAKCSDTIIGSGEPLYDWSPKFTFHGFRYVQVDGWPGGGPSTNDIQALVMHTDMRRRGFFECSNPYVNQLHKNVVWSMRGNFLSIPTDCPQRDERLGWTGDLQVFCPTATFLYDTLGILGNWLEDVAAEQLEEGKGGIPPLVVPLAISPNWPHIAQAVWDDVTVLAPDALYQYSSDKGLLEKQFASMQTWLDEGVDRASDGLWNPDKWQLADWLDPSAPPDDPGNGRTDSILVANAYLVHTTLVFSRLCAAVGKLDLAAKYASDGERLKQLFQRRYITPEGNLMSSSQTGLSLAFRFGLYPDDVSQRQTAAKALEKLVRTARFHISTGFAGTPVISHALTKIGRPQLAYRMLLETTCPSWLYPVVSKGATTIWERWDSMLSDGRINPGQMTSFNHYALGAVADWLHGSVGGISPQEPGWRMIRVEPVPGGNLTNATVSFDGPYGKVACEWVLDGTDFKMRLEVPPSCSAAVFLPSGLPRSFAAETEKQRAVVMVQSGVHEFEDTFDPGEWPPLPLVAANQPLPSNTIAG
ncbi:alfa-L-rhamnosidase [Colletotrichum godetiae]|uniref:alpha-L-rhamnosidase n=1 Tax=Colletotrichum godetiae TaxID=1209918 RepID=A0AAJ0AMX4_9PEZI|nr:alfa-L-rhamnosidase [Colletotrichum godetiae]KAK1676214.1 alfa-L-rhamnosidase [Colletotrichum godetiae]